MDTSPKISHTLPDQLYQIVKSINPSITSFYLQCVVKIFHRQCLTFLTDFSVISGLSTIFIGQEFVIQVPDITIPVSGNKYSGRKYFIKNPHGALFFGWGKVSITADHYTCNDIEAIWVNNTIYPLTDNGIIFKTPSKIKNFGLDITVDKNPLTTQIKNNFITVILTKISEGKGTQICPYANLYADKMIGHLIYKDQYLNLIIDLQSVYLTRIDNGEAINVKISNSNFWNIILTEDVFTVTLKDVFNTTGTN